MGRAPKPSRIDPETLYTPTELAAYLCIQPRTLEVWRRTRQHPELRFRRVGRRIRYLGSDILNFINADVSPKPRKQRGAR